MSKTNRRTFIAGLAAFSLGGRHRAKAAVAKEPVISIENEGGRIFPKGIPQGSEAIHVAAQEKNGVVTYYVLYGEKNSRSSLKLAFGTAGKPLSHCQVHYSVRRPFDGSATVHFASGRTLGFFYAPPSDKEGAKPVAIFSKLAHSPASVEKWARAAAEAEPLGVRAKEAFKGHADLQEWHALLLHAMKDNFQEISPTDSQKCDLRKLTLVRPDD